MPPDEVPADPESDFLSLCDDARRQPSEVPQIARVKQCVRVILGYEQP